MKDPNSYYLFGIIIIANIITDYVTPLWKL